MAPLHLLSFLSYHIVTINVHNKPYKKKIFFSLAIPWGGAQKVEAEDSLLPDFKWTFEDIAENVVRNAGKEQSGETGLTCSFWIKPDQDHASYAHVLSSKRWLFI